MTIKVCKQKTNDIISNIINGLYWLAYSAMWVVLGYAIYSIPYAISTSIYGPIVVIGIILPIFGISMFELMCEPLQKLNKKLKIFEWNEDC